MKLDKYVANNISGLQGATVNVDIEFDLSKLSKRISNALIRALHSGILPAESGNTALYYYIFVDKHNWNKPHIWGTGQWSGKRFLLTPEQATQLSPYFLLQGYSLDKKSWYTSAADYAYYQPSDDKGYQAANLTKDDKPIQVDKMLKQWDIRNPDEVDEAIKAVENGSIIKISGEI